MLFTLILLISCSKPLDDSFKRRPVIDVPFEWQEVIASGDSKRIIAYWEEERKEENMSRLFNFHSYEQGSNLPKESINLNYPFLLLLTFPRDKDMNERRIALKYLIDNFMIPTARGANYIDPNQNIGGVTLVALLSHISDDEEFEYFLNKTGASVKGIMVERLPLIVIPIFKQNLRRFRSLLNRGADLETGDGPIVAAYAFWCDDVDVLEELLRRRGREHLNRRLSNGMYACDYGAARGDKERAICWALANGIKYHTIKDIALMKAKKIASLGLFSLGSSALDVANSLLPGSVYILQQLLVTAAKEFVQWDFDERMKEKAWKFISYVLAKGEWLYGVKENDELKFEKAQEALKNIISKNKRVDGDLLIQLKELLKNVPRFKKYNAWERFLTKYRSIVSLINERRVNKEAEKVETLQRGQKIGIEFISSDVKYYKTAGNLVGTIEDAAQFEKGFEEIGVYIPSVKEMELLLKYPLFPDGDYLTSGKNILGDREFVRKENGEIIVGIEPFYSEKNFLYFGFGEFEEEK